MKSVLVVDDDVDVCNLVASKLEIAGYDVDTASDGESALLAAIKGDHDLVILDVMMPRLSGIEVCQKLRAHATTRSTPVIILTARTEPRDRNQSVAVGADVFITKPFSTNDLVRKVRSLIGS